MTPSEMRQDRANWTPAPLDPRDRSTDTEVAVTVNGQPRRFAAGTTVAELLRLLDLDPRTIVVEHNREIVRDREALARREVCADDVLELVHFVGGG